MTWVKVDDKLTTHPKWLPLTLEAKSLWFHAAVWCGAHNNDWCPSCGWTLPLDLATVSPRVVP